MFVRMSGQGPRVGAAASAAVGETILSGEGFIPSPAKWWGPAVLEAACGRTSCWAFREPAPLPSRLQGTAVVGRRFSHFPTPWARWQRSYRGTTKQGGGKD